MKRICIREPHHIEVFEDARPNAQAGEVLLAVKAVGICGSDLHVYEGLHPFVGYPVLPGHEVSGEILDVGEGLDPSLIGKKAVIEPSIPLGQRPRFEPGRYNISTALRVMGFQAPGAMAEYFAVPYENIHLVPDDFSYELGAMVEPAAVAVHAARLPGSVAGLDVAVVGAGTIGLLVAQVLKAYGAAKVDVLDLDADRRAIVSRMALNAVDHLEDNAYEVVFECVGLEAALSSAVHATRKGGTVVVLGVFGKDATLPVGLIQDWELRLQGSLMYISDDYQEAIRLLSTRQIETEQIITHRYPLAEVQDAFTQALERGETLKVILENN